MVIPFTIEQFHGVFRDYNSTVWPAQLCLLGLALVAIAVVLKPQRWSGVVISVILGALWVWSAIAHHITFFSRINPAAFAFAGFTLVGAGIFIWQGVIQRRLVFQYVFGLKAMAGNVLIAFALVVYPVWSAYSGHHYPETATFGLPCPTTIFTIGVLCFAVSHMSRSLLITPVLWCLVAAQAAFFLDVRHDLGLVAAGLVGILLLATARQPYGTFSS